NSHCPRWHVMSGSSTSAVKISATSAAPTLQRKCACGRSASQLIGDCSDCKRDKAQNLQKKLSVGNTDDPLEHEANRVAAEVLAAPFRPGLGRGAPHIQRFAGQTPGQSLSAPASVEHVLDSPGRPMDTSLQHDMGQRFGYDFSRVRVHFGGAAELSAQDVNANAYTVGNHIVFGPGRFSPGTDEGRRL